MFLKLSCITWTLQKIKRSMKYRFSMGKLFVVCAWRMLQGYSSGSQFIYSNHFFLFTRWQNWSLYTECWHPSIPHLFGVNVTKQKPHMYFLGLYFYHLYNIIFLVLCTRPCWVNPCPFHSVPQGTLYWNCWSYRTFALMEVSPQSYKEWQHYSYRGTNMYHPMLFVFGKAISLSDAPSKQQSMTAH